MAGAAIRRRRQIIIVFADGDTFYLKLVANFSWTGAVVRPVFTEHHVAREDCSGWWDRRRAVVAAVVKAHKGK